MARNSNYFPHDAQARYDTRVLRLRMKHGAAGYGVYFMLLERLRDSDDYTERAGYDVVAFDLHVEPELVKSVVEDFGLFEQTEDGGYTSASFQRRMGRIDDLSRKRANAVGKRADREKDKNGKDTKPLQNPTNALQNSTKPLQKNDFVGQIENININKNSSPDGEEEKTRGAQPSPSPLELKDFFFFGKDEDRERGLKWADDPLWVTAVARTCDIVPALVAPLVGSFMARCVSEGKRHKSEDDAKSNFTRWVTTAGGKKAVKDIGKRVVAPKRGAAPQADPMKQPPAISAKPADIIRRWGYDPEKVTMSQACNPNWRAENPPELVAAN